MASGRKGLREWPLRWLALPPDFPKNAHVTSVGLGGDQEERNMNVLYVTLGD